MGTTGKCEDTKENCDYWKGQGLCTGEKRVDFMTKNCPKVCGKCGSTTTTRTGFPTPYPITTTEGRNDCKDSKANCDYWKDKGYCTSVKWESWMAENCPKSCQK